MRLSWAGQVSHPKSMQRNRDRNYNTALYPHSHPANVPQSIGSLPEVNFSSCISPGFAEAESNSLSKASFGKVLEVNAPHSILMIIVCLRLLGVCQFQRTLSGATCSSLANPKRVVLFTRPNTKHHSALIHEGDHLCKLSDVVNLLHIACVGACT